MKKLKERILFKNTGKPSDVDWWIYIAEKICKVEDALTFKKSPYLWAWKDKVYKTPIEAINAACEGKTLKTHAITLAIRNNKTFRVNNNIIKRLTLSEFSFN